jgi:hypothetical protein
VEILVGATPGSNISNAQISVEGPNYNVNVPISAGRLERRTVGTAVPGMMVDIRIAVFSNDRMVQVFADNIPTDSTIIVTGVDADEFHANIYHPHAHAHVGRPQWQQAGLAPTCTLRCTPTSVPVTGPSCIGCNEYGLKFKVCC